MRVAIISDVHGNLSALEAIMEDIGGSNIHKIYCLGDMVGYGPQPEEVINLIRDNEISTVMGNHEMMVTDYSQFMKLNNDCAKIAINITKDIISDSSLEYIQNLPKNIVRKNSLFVHGIPPDDILDYFCFRYTKKPNKEEIQEMKRIFNSTKQKISFVGHTHKLMIYSDNGCGIIYDKLKNKKYNLDMSQKHVINVGSVGQPRDLNNNSKYVIFDSDDFTLDVRYVPYDIERTLIKMARRKLPKRNARRLLYGR